MAIIIKFTAEQGKVVKLAFCQMAVVLLAKKKKKKSIICWGRVKRGTKDPFCSNCSFTYTYYAKLIFKAFAKINFLCMSFTAQ